MEIKGGRTTSQVLNEKWWTNLIKGLLFLAFGIVTLAWPGITSEIFIYITGAVAFGIAIYKFIGIFWNRKDEGKKESIPMVFAEATLATLIGILAFALPGTIGVMVLVLFGLGMIFYGALDFWLGFSFGVNIVSVYYRWIMIIGGLFSMIVGIIILSNPIAGLLAILWLISTYAVSLGIVNIALAFTHPNRGKIKS